jgi:aspartate carbamoyltransferase catalytic subunit
MEKGGMCMQKLAHVIEPQDFNRETIEEIFLIASEMENIVKSPSDILRGKIMATFFYEPSTRTRLSFEAAMKRLGGTTISTEDAREFSSVSKGETLEDSIRIVSGYSDVIVLRYDKIGGAERARKFSSVPIINAGDGAGQHPSQALLDLYTIKKRFGRLEGLKIAMVGDLTNGRTVRSLCYFLAKHYPNNEIYFLSPEEVKMKDDIKEYLNKHNVKWQELFSFDPDILKIIDVNYHTRIQEERFKDNLQILEKVRKKAEEFIINGKTLEIMNENLIIMHPFPRVFEISYEVDNDPRAYYFEQAKNGLYVRMALLKMILLGY